MRADTHSVGQPPILSEVVIQRDELADALRWIASNCKPYGPAQAHAANTLRRCGLSLEFPRQQLVRDRSNEEN